MQWRREFYEILEERIQHLGMIEKALHQNSVPPRQGRRRRGVLLQSQSFERLLKARSESEFQENSGNRWTLEDLSDRTGLSIETVMKVFSNRVSVDKQTLEICFRAFNLKLDANEYFIPETIAAEVETESDSDLELNELEFPEGQVPLHSRFYIERYPIEDQVLKAITQPGVLIRIKSPRRMGKTSLMARVLDHTARGNFYCVYISFRLVDKAMVQDIDKFLQWLCVSVGLGLKLANRLGEFWDPLFGSKVSCKIYFEEYLLKEIIKPLVLCLDDVDVLFQYPDLAKDFFSLLRAWHEEAKNFDVWKKMHLAIVYSSEVYLPLNINQSPFNIGIPIDLPKFNCEQIKDLAQRHDLDWTSEQVDKLAVLTNGIPFLVRKALYHLCLMNDDLDKLLRTAATVSGIYKDDLQNLTWMLRQDPELQNSFLQVVNSSTPIKLDLVPAFKLQSMGLIDLSGCHAVSSCSLYQQYFQEYFNRTI